MIAGYNGRVNGASKPHRYGRLQMLARLLSSKADSSPFRGGARRSLANLRSSVIPIDGDPGRVRPTTDRDPEADGDASGGDAPDRLEGIASRYPAAHPPLRTHTRNAAEEWIPTSVLYGPPF